MSDMVTFVDPLAPRAYDGTAGALKGLGGTEATLVRVCERLAPHRPLVVRQRARIVEAYVGGVRYAAFDMMRPLPEDPRVIVVVNAWKVALKLARLHPEARVHLWLHVFPGRHNRAMGASLKAAGIDVICVSRSHARWLEDFLGESAPRITHIHNPVADHLAPDVTPRNSNLLLIASAPHKGLAQVFRRFEALRDRFPRLKLAVADPGYLAWPSGPVPRGVLPLGTLEHSALIAMMRRALCLFYPQDHFAETFGLVIAEANAVGCPALLQRGLGANDEVACDASQCIDTADPDAIAARIAALRAACPLTPLAWGRPEFRLSTVAERWLERLAPAATPQPALELVPG